MKINKEFIKEGFEIKLLDAAINNLKEQKNVLRFNNFACSIRELSRHILHRLAPDDEIQRCSWYKPTYNEQNEITITRGDRVSYAIHGGFDNNQLGLMGLLERTKTVKSNLSKTFDLLNKYTHINADTFGMSDKETETKANAVINAFNDFFEAILSARDTIIKLLEEQIDKKVMEETLYSTNSDVDLLATHASIEEYEIQKIKIISVTSTNVEIEVYGDIEARLQYGSDGDLRRDDGFVFNETFPFCATMQAPISKKLKHFKIIGEIQFAVDTNSFYEDEIENVIEEVMTNSISI